MMSGMDLQIYLQTQKYVAFLDIDNLSEPSSCDITENHTVNDSDKNLTDSCIDSKEIA